ncbi:MAG: hypothetical protein ACRCXT_08665 [Paraclostridium sp.]
MSIVEKLEKGLIITSKEYNIVEENLLAFALLLGVDMDTVLEQAQKLLDF